jgi:hypothetical protein
VRVGARSAQQGERRRIRDRCPTARTARDRKRAVLRSAACVPAGARLFVRVACPSKRARLRRAVRRFDGGDRSIWKVLRPHSRAGLVPSTSVTTTDVSPRRATVRVSAERNSQCTSNEATEHQIARLQLLLRMRSILKSASLLFAVLVACRRDQPVADRSSGSMPPAFSRASDPPVASSATLAVATEAPTVCDSIAAMWRTVPRTIVVVHDKIVEPFDCNAVDQTRPAERLSPRPACAVDIDKDSLRAHGDSATQSRDDWFLPAKGWSELWMMFADGPDGSSQTFQPRASSVCATTGLGRRRRCRYHVRAVGILSREHANAGVTIAESSHPIRRSLDTGRWFAPSSSTRSFSRRHGTRK